MRPLALALLAVLLAACGGSSNAGSVTDAGTDATSSPDASRTGASEAGGPVDATADGTNGAGEDANGTSADGGDANPASAEDAGVLTLPQVLGSTTKTLAAPKLIAVTFPGDTEAPQIDAFTQAIGASAYWKAVTSEYGVGAAIGETIFETDLAPTTVNLDNGDPETWLATRFDGTHPEWGTFDPSAVYLVFYPSTSVFTPTVGGCGGAYHDVLSVNVAASADGGMAIDGAAPTPVQMVYAVVARCASTIDVGRPSGINLTTFMASHEMVEAVTDPWITGYVQTDLDHVAWAYFFGSEVGDMCAFHPGAAITPTDIGYSVQRAWSNAAAAAFEDPCVPGESDPLFLAAPLGESAISLPDGNGGSYASKGFSLPSGTSLTVDIQLYGAATGSWTVTPFTYTMEHGQPEPYLQFTPTTLTGKSGDVVKLTIKRIAEDTDGNGADAVKLVSTMGSVSNEWYFAVTD